MKQLELEQVPIDQCSLVRAARILGDRWTLLVLRQVIYGRRRFEQIVEDLSVSRSVLTGRLTHLVDSGILRRVPEREEGQRTRHSYQLTRAGVELVPVLIALMQWGDRHLADSAEPPLRLTHADCGAPVTVKPVCDSGHVVTDLRELVSRKSG